MIVSLIAALAEKRVIGLDGKMPWHLPADLAYFKRSTMGCPVIMGRKTFESIGKPLPGRRNIVLSRNRELVLPGCDVFANIHAALDDVDNENAAEVFIIGGQQLYEQALPMADKLYLTHIDAKFEGDTIFPDYTELKWQQVSVEKHSADEKNPWPYRFEQLERAGNH
jgi:dihydrofolate reductase